jgi:tripartite-type tricarboxylate transporter receptor subunit TctC
VDRLNAEIRKIVDSAEVKGAWEKQGAVAMSMSPEEFGRFMREDIEKWARVVKVSGAKPDR